MNFMPRIVKVNPQPGYVVSHRRGAELFEHLDEARDAVGGLDAPISIARVTLWDECDRLVWTVDGPFGHEIVSQVAV